MIRPQLAWGAFFLALALSVLPAAAEPRRIVSLNVCADQLLLELARRERIASLTIHAVDAEFSNLSEAARGFRLNRGRAEEVLALAPDLVIGGEYTTGATIALLRRLGLRVEILPLARSLDEVRFNIRRLAGWIGEDRAGEAMVAGFDARLAAVAARIAGRRRPVTALYQTRGATALPGSLEDSVITAAGFENLARRLGLGGTGRLRLEDLLMHEHDALLVVDAAGQAPSLEIATLAHPVLRRILAAKPHVALPSRLWVCETSFVVDAIERIAALHDVLPRMPR